MRNLDVYNSVFLKIFNVTEDELCTLKHRKTSSWDSLTHMVLISLLEEKFDIRLEIDDIINIDSYEKGIIILRNYGVDI